jgi:hypothetical protein
LNWLELDLKPALNTHLQLLITGPLVFGASSFGLWGICKTLQVLVTCGGGGGDVMVMDGG